MSVIVGSILIVMGVIFPQSPGQDSLNKGIKAFRDANYKSAIEYFKQATEVDPNFALAWASLSTAELFSYWLGSDQSPARRPSHLLRRAAALGLAVGASSPCETLLQEGVGHFSLRGTVVPRARRGRGVRGTSAGRP